MNSTTTPDETLFLMYLSLGRSWEEAAPLAGLEMHYIFGRMMDPDFKTRYDHAQQMWMASVRTKAMNSALAASDLLQQSMRGETDPTVIARSAVAAARIAGILCADLIKPKATLTAKPKPAPAPVFPTIPPAAKSNEQSLQGMEEAVLRMEEMMKKGEMPLFQPA